MKKKLFKWLKIVLIAYTVIGLALYYFQEALLFHPVPLAASYRYSFPVPFNEANIPYDSATDFNLVQFRLPTDTGANRSNKHGAGCKGVVLYFHGNRQNINRYAPFAKNFTQNGYEVWMIDYPGFGKSTGTLSEQLLYEEALQFYKLANVQFHADSIILYGKSLGTGIAARLASMYPCKKLILETPYYSLISMARHYAGIYPVGYTAKYRIPTNEYFKKITAPIAIFHGTDDGVVPYSNASKLKMVMKPTDEFITIENGTHNNLSDFPLFHQKLDSLLR